MTPQPRPQDGDREGPEVMEMNGPEPSQLVFLIPIAGMAMVVTIVGIIFWFKARQKELEFHQEIRIREMEHQRRVKELDLEMEKLKAAQSPGKGA